jgi:hypothetical protein
MGKSTVIIPKKLSVDPRKMAQAITNTLNATALGIRTDFAVTVQTWNDKPLFAITSPTVYTREIGTDDAIYAMLNEGTKAHEIFPKPGKILVFGTPFRSKTLPRQIASGPGSKGKQKVISRHGVHHPGTDARQWDTTIADKWRKQFPTVMQRAIDAAAH